jgi:lipopolysaccharide transport system ATP-binding protein
LKNVSFSVGKGEIVGLIGRNGAGKSTLLKIMSRITYPTSGKIKLLGKVGSLLEVGTGFHEELSGRENVFLNGSILGMKKNEVKQKLDAIVDFAEVEKFLDTPIKHYSSGMRLRLGFAVAAHLDTDILFIDEVLSVGDASFQEKCIEKIKNLRSGGRTVLVVSHSMATMENICPRAVWIDNGELIEDGRTEDIVNSYMSAMRGKWSPDTKITEFSVGIQQSGFDLTNVPNRAGNGDIQFTGIEFFRQDGQPKKRISCGDDLKVRLYYQAHKTVMKPDFYLRIRNEFGEKIATFGTSLSGHKIPELLPGSGYVDVDIDSINIMPDRYYLTLWINNSSVIVNNEPLIYDDIDRCAPLDIKYIDYYRSGRGIEKNWGVTFMPCRWNFEGMQTCPMIVKQPQGQ